MSFEIENTYSRQSIGDPSAYAAQTRVERCDELPAFTLYGIVRSNVNTKDDSQLIVLLPFAV